MKRPLITIPTSCWVEIVLLLLAVTILYGHTLQVPFYLDDTHALLNNHLLRSLGETFRQVVSQRGLTNLTFALNYRWSGFALPPLHATNLILHALNGMLVWLLLRRWLAGRWLPLLGGVLFIAHPLQTQGVTYLVQRATVLGTLFLLLAVILYLRARAALASGAPRGAGTYWRPYGGALLAGAAAVLAKENTVVLPLLLLACEPLLTAPGGPRNWSLALRETLPFVVFPLLFGSWTLATLAAHEEIAVRNLVVVSVTHDSPLYYLVTQFSVVWIYLRLLLLPYGQALEHGYPVATQVLTGQNLLALAGLLGLTVLTWRLRATRPLLALGVVWFFLGLAVESSVIPLDPMFEHRLYLPMFGFVLVLLDGLPALLGAKRAWVVLGLLLVIWLPLTWRRNALWNDPRAFYADNLRVAPASERAHLALGLLQVEQGRPAEAEETFRGLLRLNPRYNVAYQELARLYAGRGAPDQALALVEAGLRLMPEDVGIFKAGAEVLFRNGQPQAALAFLQRGVAAAPASARMRAELAALYFELGKLAEAETTYREALRLRSAGAATHKNLAKVLYAQGRMAEAMSELRTAIRMQPLDPDILEGLGMCALALDDHGTVSTTVDRLERLDRERALRLRAALIESRERTRP